MTAADVLEIVLVLLAATLAAVGIWKGGRDFGGKK